MTTLSFRRTVVAQGRLAMREQRLSAARASGHGLQVMSVEQLASRLAGGFVRPIDEEALRAAIQLALPMTDLGELEAIKQLPGMVDAATETLKKAWRAGVDLASRAGEHRRLDAMARLEAAVLAQLPAGMMRPSDLAAAALLRLEHAPAVLGPVDIVGVADLAPCWRLLLLALAERTPVRWLGGPRPPPGWLQGGAMTVTTEPAQAPTVTAISAATAYHEAIEAIRWARGLLASGQALPAEIAIAAASTAEYDDHFLALRSDANLDLHFVHGVKATTVREGQAAAALADIVLRGLSQTRVRRLVALCGEAEPLRALPADWTRVLPADAPLASLEAWRRLVGRLTTADWPDGQDHTQSLRALVELLAQGADAASDIGEAMLVGRARALWRKALLAGPVGSLEASLEALKLDDGLEACAAMAWMPASALASSPRRFVRLLGLNAGRWPRGLSEDRLIPDHVIASGELDPLPVSATDRRDFTTILATSREQVVLSRARRDSEGRLLGRSALLDGFEPETYLRRHAVPPHAFSETDRLTARPAEFATYPIAVGALDAWRDWRRDGITPHDGQVRADHPAIQAILGRTQSASSLSLLLRNPIGFVWRYGLGLGVPEGGADPLVLDALATGDLIHRTLDVALQALEAQGGVAGADAAQVAAAVEAAANAVASDWVNERAAPPAVIWRRTLQDARILSERALLHNDAPLPDSRAYSEVAFGGATPKSTAAAPWDTQVPVEIPGTGFRISGYIDRLDLAGNGQQALVRDYKTGRPPKAAIRLNGGRELQRCLYGFAVQALLGHDVSINASLLYLRDMSDLQLDDSEATLTEVAGYLRASREALQAGGGLIGPDSGGDYDDLAFALPANASADYCRRKAPSATLLMGEAARVWDAP